LDLFVHGTQGVALGCHSTRLRRSKLYAFEKKRKKQRSKQSLQHKLRFALIRSKAKFREANLRFGAKGVVQKGLFPGSSRAGKELSTLDKLKYKV